MKAPDNLPNGTEVVVKITNNFEIIRDRKFDRRGKLMYGLQSGFMGGPAGLLWVYPWEVITMEQYARVRQQRIG